MGLYALYAVVGVVAAFVLAAVVGAVMEFFRLGRCSSPHREAGSL